MGYSHFKLAHATTHHKTKRATQPNTTCTTGGFYQSPTTGQTINSLEPLDIAWDPSCLDTKAVDIYLYAPGAERSRIHVWQNVAFQKGSYQVDLMPRWWNSTDRMNLQLSIIETGLPPFLSTLPAAPVFTATYSPPSSGGTPAAADASIVDSGLTQVNNVDDKNKMTSGKTAAAVIVPLLFVLLCVGAYLKMQRSKGREKRKRWSEAVDKRMSTISTDWKSISGAGANAAIRNSIAIPGNRNSSASSFAFGAIRPASVVDGGQAGIGAGASPEMTQLRPGVGPRIPKPPGERVSRISFAADTRVSRVSFAADPRPSGESSRSRATQSRAFHSSFVPPMPTPRLDLSATSSTDGDGALSPTQARGAMALTPEDIRARMNDAGSTLGRKSGDEGGVDEEVMPALSLMRTGGGMSPSDPSFTETSDDLIFPPAPPAPTHAKSPTAPLSPAMQMQPVPAGVMSPDEMLRAYAERKKAAGAGGFAAPGATMGVGYPAPVAGGGSGSVSAKGGMRTLYAVPRDEESAYGGTY